MGGRKSYSCLPCRNKKVKCDRHRLCGYCAKRNLECIWPDNGVPLEDEVEGASSSPSKAASIPLENHQPLHTYDISASAIRPEPNYSATRSSLVDVPQTVVQAEQLDHSILNDAHIDLSEEDSVNENGQLEGNGQTGEGKAVGTSGSQMVPKTSKRKRAFPFFNQSYDGDGMVTDELLENLPTHGMLFSPGSKQWSDFDTEESDILLRIYLERVEWIHHPLHLPAFLVQYNKFWSMTPSQRKSKVHSRWTALLFIVLCLGEHFADSDAGKNEDLERRLLVACEDSLSQSDFLDQPSTETIQTIICLNLYLNNRNKVNAARSLLGTAIKMAISLGMSRIPDEGQHVAPQGIVERELGRRLWWSLVTQDAYTASNSGFTYLINLSHASTSLPSNLDDDEILPPPHFLPRPFDEMTTSTYHITKVDFALVVRSFIDVVNKDFPNASYEGIMSLDRQFRQVYASLPAPLRPDLPQPFELSHTGSKRYLLPQRIFSGITLHNRIMRLHRAYMVRGYEDERYEYSTRACLESAYALLDLVRQEKGILCRWWVVLVQVWTAGLIIGVDLLRGARGNEEGWGRRQRAGLGVAVSLLEPISKSSPVAVRGVQVLRALIASSTNLPNPPLSQLVQPAASHTGRFCHDDDHNPPYQLGESSQRSTPSILAHSSWQSHRDKLHSLESVDGNDRDQRKRQRVEWKGDRVEVAHDALGEPVDEDQPTSERCHLELGNTSFNDLDLLLQGSHSFAPPTLGGETNDPAAAEFWESLFGMGQW
ncbi:hypothetical protein IAR50_006173 [Cryptococcus sp. DSM 104548]